MSARNTAITTSVAAALVSACQSAPPAQDVAGPVEFLRGCWVTKQSPGGPARGFLRLLPSYTKDGSYHGVVQAVNGAAITNGTSVAFARDGSSMMLNGGRAMMPLDDMNGQTSGFIRTRAALPAELEAKLPKAKHRITYAVYPDRPTTPWIAAEGDDKTIAIYMLGNGGQSMGDLFRGDRDGCD